MLKRVFATTVALSVLTLLAGCGDEGGEAKDPATADPTSTSTTGDPAASGAECEFTEDGTKPARKVELPPTTPSQTGEVPATISTNVGDIKVMLSADTDPCTVTSFVSLAEQSYYDDTTCHRLTTDGIYVLQCGDPTGTGMSGPGYTIKDELDGDEDYSAGALAMAKTQFPDSGGSQFFLVYDDSTGLPKDYTTFGTIDPDGVKVLQRIAKQGTVEGTTDGPPKNEVTISTVTVG